MLTPLDFYDRLHEKPFRPFRVFLKDGRVFDIHYPELNMVGVSYLIIGVPALDGSRDCPVAEYSNKVPLSLIERVEAIGVCNPCGGSAMLTPVEFYDRLHEEPFRPFRVYLKDGQMFDIRYPHITRVGVDYLIIGVPAEESPMTFAEYTVKVPISSIDRVESLAMGTAPVSH